MITSHTTHYTSTETSQRDETPAADEDKPQEDIQSRCTRPSWQSPSDRDS